MTEDPNQQFRPTVFHEQYPATATSSAWGMFNEPNGQEAKPPYNFAATYQQPSQRTGVGNFQFGQFGTQSTSSSTPAIQFPFSRNNFNNESRIDSRIFCNNSGVKRKTDSPPPLPAKQHITEEKMTEHMSRLHISSETTTSMSESEKTQRLYMCEEMRKLQSDPILPPSLLVPRPCTALVLWQPPRNILDPPRDPPVNNMQVEHNRGYEEFLNRNNLVDNNNDEQAEDQNVVVVEENEMDFDL